MKGKNTNLIVLMGTILFGIFIWSIINFFISGGPEIVSALTKN